MTCGGHVQSIVADLEEAMYDLGVETHARGGDYRGLQNYVTNSEQLRLPRHSAAVRSQHALLSFAQRSRLAVSGAERSRRAS